MRIEIDHFLAQLPIEAGHYRDYKNQHRHAEHNAENGNQGDNRQKRALRLQVPQSEKKTKGQFQSADTVAANLLFSNKEN
jgi:hypothetical protein